MNARDKELAKQAWTENDWDGHVDIPKLIQLVRADERSNIRPQSSMAYQEGMEAGRLAEREACAKVCESLWRIDGQFSADEFASEVRARGNT